MMHGQIEVDSEVNKGSTFRFTAEFRTQPKGAGIEWTLPPELRGMNVLIVDDNQAARNILASMLTTFSCTVVEADGAPEALKTIRSHGHKYDLIVMDWLMPEMDGLEATRIIRQAKALPQPSIILMVTAHDRGDVLNQAKELNLQSFLVKPVSPWALFDAIVGLPDGVATSLDPPTNTVAMPENEKISATILLVEDDEINQQVARELLENMGVSVEIAEDGAEAVEMSCGQDFDLIFMDIQMPAMDGLEATRKIRQRGLVDVPIIAMTAHALVDDRDKSLRAGMNDHITKPIDPDILYKTLRRWLKRNLDDAINLRAPVPTDAIRTADHCKPIDYRLGLERVGGNRMLFTTLLKNFRANHGEDIGLIRQAIKDERFDDVERLLHTIIGVAGNIGAIKMQERATLCESLLKQGQAASFIDAVHDFSEAFEAVMNCLNTYETDRENTPSGADQNTTN